MSNQKQPKIKIRKITKTCERKVNLSGVSSRYDNIALSTMLEAEIAYSNPEEFHKISKALAEEARRQVDDGIKDYIVDLTKQAEDPDNHPSLGLGGKPQTINRKQTEKMLPTLKKYMEEQNLSLEDKVDISAFDESEEELNLNLDDDD